MILLPHKVGPAGAYTLHRKLGTGGVAESYLGTHDAGSGRTVVLRRLLPYITRDPARLASIQARITDLLGVRHPFLVHVLDQLVEGDEHWVVEEHVDGVTLESVLAWCRQGGHHMPHNVFLNIATQVCNGLEALHGRGGKGTGAEHVLHHALKPSAVFISREGKVLVGSYGLTRSPTTFPHGGVSGPVPTRMEYLSPEQTHPDQKLTPSSDIFSLGALLYEVLTLESLFRAESNLQTIHRVRRAEVTSHLLRVKERMPGLDKVLFRALSLNPRHRYQRAFVLREDLRGLMAGYSFATIGEDTRAFLAPLSESQGGPKSSGGFVAGLDDAPASSVGADAFDDSPATRIDPDPMTTAAIAAQALAERVARERGPDRTEHTDTAAGEASLTPLQPLPPTSGAPPGVDPSSTAAWLPARPASTTLTPELPAANVGNEENTAAALGLPAHDAGSEISLSMPLDAPDRAPPRVSPPTITPELPRFAPPKFAPTPMVSESVEDPVSARSATPVVAAFPAAAPSETLTPEASPLPPAPVPPAPVPPAPAKAAPVPQPSAPAAPAPRRPSIADRAPPPGAVPQPPPRTTRPAAPPPAFVPPYEPPPVGNDALFEQPAANGGGWFTTAAFAAFGLVILCSGAGVLGFRIWESRAPLPITETAPPPRVEPTAPLPVDDAAATLAAAPETPPAEQVPAPSAVAEPVPAPTEQVVAAATPVEKPLVTTPPKAAVVEKSAPAEKPVAAAKPAPAPPTAAKSVPPAATPRTQPAPPTTRTTPAAAVATTRTAPASTASAPASTSRTVATVAPAATVATAATASLTVVADPGMSAALDGYSSTAKAGKLTSADVAALEQTAQSDPNYTRSRAILLMNAQKKNDDPGQKRYLDQLMALPENQYNPIYLADYARWSVNHGEFSQALDRAQRAERYWGRLPSELVFSKKAEIYEVEAAAWQGKFYKSGEDLELLDNAVRGWERYKVHVATKSRSDLEKRADTELAKLNAIRERLQ